MRDRSEFDDLAPLIKLIRAHPPFDRETELTVTRRARKGERRAQEQLVVHNLSLVISVARKFMGRGVRLEDLVQEGNYGLLKEIGKEWGLSRERVRQVEKSTRSFLSRYLAQFDEAA